MNKIWCNHWTLLVRWPLHKYKCLWNVGDKSSTLQKGTSYTYTHRLWYSRISILKKKKKNWCGKQELMISIYLFQKPLEISSTYFSYSLYVFLLVRWFLHQKSTAEVHVIHFCPPTFLSTLLAPLTRARGVPSLLQYGIISSHHITKNLYSIFTKKSYPIY